MLGFYLETGNQTDAEEILVESAKKVRAQREMIFVTAIRYGAEPEAGKTVEEAVRYYCTNETAFVIGPTDVRLFAGGNVKLKKSVCRAIVSLILQECFIQGANINLTCK